MPVSSLGERHCPRAVWAVYGVARAFLVRSDDMIPRSTLVAFSLVSAAAAFLACSSSSTSTADGGKTGSSTGASSSSRGTGPGSSSGAASSTHSTRSGSSSSGDAGPTNPFECTVPATPPSGGSCVTLVAPNDAGTGVECNPVTNAGCTGGAACDINTNSSLTVIGFACYPPPATATICDPCSDHSGPFCGPNLTCLSLRKEAVCASYCCTNADCGGGVCSTSLGGLSLFGPLAPSVGVCTLTAQPDAGAPSDSGPG